MGKALLTAWAVLVSGAGWGFAQVKLGAPAAVQTEASRNVANPSPSSATVDRFGECPPQSYECAPASCERGWARADYLVWWLRDGAPSFALLTTGDAAVDPLAGALGAPTTRVLFAGSDLNHDSFSGLRLSVGSWLNRDALIGIEGSAFLLEQRRTSFAAGSNAAGSPLLTVPAFLTDFGAAGEERRFFVSDPVTPFVGSINMSTATRMWGAEANGVGNLMSSATVDVDVLLGFAYLRLDDEFALNATTPDGTDVRGQLRDRFAANNDFYGGQLGTRIEIRRGRWSLGVAGKVALGAMHQVVDVSGSTVLSGAGVNAVLGVNPGTYPGAIYSQASNLGRQAQDYFAVVPQIQCKLAYQVSNRLRALVGYDFLYWNEVVRAGSQVSRVINSSQSPLSANFGQNIGAAAPLLPFNRTDFWAQGINVGLEIRY